MHFSCMWTLLQPCLGEKASDTTLPLTKQPDLNLYTLDKIVSSFFIVSFKIVNICKTPLLKVQFLNKCFFILERDV